ncbi:IS3 family transposase [Paenibacillus sp. URB8-2]
MKKSGLSSSYFHSSVELQDYVHWFNYHRIHGTLRYLTPVQARKAPS